MFYKKILKPIFFLTDPEGIHDFMILVGNILGRFSFTRYLTSLFYDYWGPDISKKVDGIRYRTPFILSAGFDYNGRLTRILSHVAFGGEEIGSVTAWPCEGNPKPRLKRLVKSESILVNKGLRNEGVEKIIQRLKATPREKDFVCGISIAHTNDASSVSVEDGINDYLYSFRVLNEQDIGDFYTINISCPNAFGGESFVDPVLFERLMQALDAVKCLKPIYIKMPINIDWSHFDSILKICTAHRVNGVVIGNLNKDYNDLEYRNEAPASYAGGLSGKPCRKLSTELIRLTREKYGSRFTIIGVGGVASPETAREKFEAGADLVQLITGMIFEGPGLIKKLSRNYSRQ